MCRRPRQRPQPSTRPVVLCSTRLREAGVDRPQTTTTMMISDNPNSNVTIARVFLSSSCCCWGLGNREGRARGNSAERICPRFPDWPLEMGHRSALRLRAGAKWGCFCNLGQVYSVKPVRTPWNRLLANGVFCGLSPSLQE